MEKHDGKSTEKFLEPSFRYLVENGFENTSVRDLCRAMKISYGSIYYWFDNKDDIYISVVKYGISKVANQLFKFAFDNMAEPERFFADFLDEVDKYKHELRLIFQVTTSPVYGDRMRIKAEDFKVGYAEYTEKLAGIIGCSMEEMIPIIYLIISILVDYVVWEDLEVSKMQLEYLHNIVKTKISAGELDK